MIKFEEIKKKQENIIKKKIKNKGLSFCIFKALASIDKKIPFFFFKIELIFWIIVIVDFYKNNLINATSDRPKTLILQLILGNIRLDL